MKKRFFSWLLAAAMCFSLLPQVALAEEESIVRNEQEETEADVSNEADADVSAVQAMIDALPSVEEVSEGDYDAVQAAYDAYDALTAEQQAQISGADCFGVLFGWFNGQIAVQATNPVAEVYDTQYDTLAEAIAAANDAEITLLRIFGENVVVENGDKASIILGNGGYVEGEGNYPSNWVAMTGGDPPYIPLTMNGGEITLKDGVLAQGQSGADNNIAIKLAGGTLTVADSVTKIQGGYIDSRKQFSIQATGGVLDLQGNTQLDGGLSISGDARLAHKLKAGIFTNSEDRERISLKGNEYAYPNKIPDSQYYATVFDLLETGYVFAKYDGSKAGDVIAKDDTTKALAEDVIVIKCKHEGGFTDGKCDQCGVTCAHEKVDESGKCDTCKQQMGAKDNNNKYYLDLAEALEGIADGGTVTLLADSTGQLYFEEKTVTLDMNGKTLSHNGGLALSVASGELTVINGTNDPIKINYTGTEGSDAIGVGSGKLILDGKLQTNGSVNVTGGSIAFKQAATIEKGLQVKNNGTIDGGLPVGSIIKKGSDGNSVSVENSRQYNNVLELLDGKQLAFAEYDENVENKAGDLVGGNRRALNRDFKDVIVVAHPKHTMKPVQTPDPSYKSDIYECDCGFICLHEAGFTNGICSTCGVACAHPSVDESNKCTKCNTQMVVKVETGEDGNKTTTYYAKTTNTAGGENTLQALLNDDNITPSGSTVTLLANDLLAWAFVDGGKTITLNLNGKRLTESGQGIAIDPSSTLKVTGEGSSVENTSASYSYVFNVRGGTLVFDDGFGGTFNGIRVGSGTLTSTRDDSHDIHIGTLEIADSSAKISFKQGTFDKIVVEGANVSVKLGDLLGKNSGKAFQKADGTFLRYDTVITSTKAVENVTITACPHDSITGVTCDYCGMENIAAVLTKPDGGIVTYTTNEGSANAFTGLANNGGTLKLYSDLTYSLPLGTQGDTTEMVIDLNGHQVKSAAEGTEITLNGGKLTIQDSSENKTGSFANVTVNGGAGLVVDGVAVGKITAADKTAKVTLKEGSKFTGYNIPAGMILADWIEDGYCIMDSEKPVSISSASESYQVDTAMDIFTVKKVPATITAGNKSGDIRYGENISATFLPSVASTGSETQYSIEWYRGTDNGWVKLDGGTLAKDGTYTPDASVLNFSGVSKDDKLNMLCVITAKDSTDNALWQTAVKGYTLTVTKGTATVKNAPKAVAGLTYNGNAQALITAGAANGGEMQYSLDGTNYSATIPTGENAGNYTVWHKAKGDSNHDDSTPQSVTVTIAPMQLSATPYSGNAFLNGANISRGYDGTREVLVGIDGFVKANGSVTNDSDRITLTLNQDYTITRKEFDSAEVGTRTATLEFEMLSGNYTFVGNAKEAKYEISGCSIRKAPKSELKINSGSLTIVNGQTATYTYGLSQLLPALTSPRSYGDVSYTATWNGAVSSYTVEDIETKDGVLSAKIDATNGNAGTAGSFTITVESTNYNIFTLTINVNAVNKIVPQGKPTLSAITLTYGDTLSKITLSGTMQDGDTEVEGAFAWVNPDAKVGPAGKYAATWVFTPNDKTKYADVTGAATIIVNKATPTGTPAYDAITASGKTLADAKLTTGTITPDGTIAWDLADTTEVTANTAYAWTFTPNDTTNYETLTGSITLYRVSSGGGGGGGSTKHTVATPSSANGKVTPDKTNVSKGALVTITPKADAGYVLDKITVVDKNGNEIKLTDMGNGTYTFTMPATAVEIKPEFKKAEETQPTGGNEKKTVVQLQIGSKQLVANGVTSEKDAAPVIRNNRTLVPIRFITESLGGKVSWNAATKEVTLLIDGKEIKMTIGKTLETYGVAPIIIGERTYVPVRFVADALGAQTAWNDATKTVTIVKETK